MILTGKCNEDFEKWFKANVSYEYYGDQSSYNITEDFTDIPFSMQYGVYVDFFDSVGVIIEIQADDQSDYFIVLIDNLFNGSGKTRHEARTKAIEKANELYNNKNVK